MSQADTPAHLWGATLKRRQPKQDISHANQPRDCAGAGGMDNHLLREIKVYCQRGMI